jgi:hypothetical protein
VGIEDRDKQVVFRHARILPDAPLTGAGARRRIAGMSIFRALKSGLARLLGIIFDINPPSDSHPPDIDGRRDSGDMGYQRAALEAKMRDQVGPGGTPG